MIFLVNHVFVLRFVFVSLVFPGMFDLRNFQNLPQENVLIVKMRSSFCPWCIVAASSISLSADGQRALLVDFSCAVHQSTVVSDDLVDVVRDVLPPHLISPEACTLSISTGHCWKQWDNVANARWEWVPDCGGCNTKTTGGKGSANTRIRQQVGVCRA